MRRLIWPLIGLIILASACAAPGINLTYTLPATQGTDGRTVSLVVNDKRGTTEFLSGTVKEEEVFPEAYDNVDLTTQNPGGLVNARYNIRIIEAFEEAFRRRLMSQGYEVASNPTVTFPTLEVDLEKFQLDLDGRTFKADIVYTVRFFQDGREVRNERVFGQASKFYVRAQQTAEETLSEALTSSVNSLDLSPLFQ